MTSREIMIACGKNNAQWGLASGNQLINRTFKRRGAIVRSGDGAVAQIYYYRQRRTFNRSNLVSAMQDIGYRVVYGRSEECTGSFLGHPLRQLNANEIWGIGPRLLRIKSTGNVHDVGAMLGAPSGEILPG